MEQKKILWILLSVTLFLFIISIAGVVWFYPGKIAVADNGSKSPSNNQEQAALEFDPIEWVRDGKDFPGLVETPPSDEEGFSIVYGETDSSEPAATHITDGAVKEVDDKPLTSDLTAPSVVEQKAVKVVTPKKNNVAAPSPRKITVLEYWIQAGSFTSRSRAESASKTLSEKGFSNLITIKTVDDGDYYRVRMGPYVSNAEAEKFLAWVKEIDSYEKSYISQVYVQKTVN